MKTRVHKFKGLGYNLKNKSLSSTKNEIIFIVDAVHTEFGIEIPVETMPGTHQ